MCVDGKPGKPGYETPTLSLYDSLLAAPSDAYAQPIFFIPPNRKPWGETAVRGFTEQRFSGTMHGMKKRVAVFDIDGTIFRSSLLVELTETLTAMRIFPRSVRLRYLPAYHAWLDRTGTYEAYLERLIRAFDAAIRGVRAEEFISVAREVAAYHAERLYRYTRDLVRTLRSRSYYLLAISHSPKYAVEAFAKQLGFRKVYGRMLEVDKRGRFTGRTLHEELIMDKAAILERAAAKEGLTLRNSFGVGDSESDIPFLKLVTHPIAFNPNRALYTHAKRAGWNIVVERKDVIYEL